jgi:DNA-binding CsgD family transcriptional regulator
MSSPAWPAQDRSDEENADGPLDTVDVSALAAAYTHYLSTLPSPNEFANWAQSSFRVHVPHQHAMFAVAVRHSLGFSVHRLLPIDMPPEFLNCVRGPDSTIVCPVVYDWFRMRSLQTFDVSTPGHLERSAWFSTFRRQHFRFQLVHGYASEDDEVVSFISLYAQDKISPPTLLLLKLLVPEIARCLMRLFDVSAASRASGKEMLFTKREVEIIDWISAGKTNWEIGQILGISELTVKSHLQRLFSKTGTNSRIQLAARVSALRRDW